MAEPVRRPDTGHTGTFAAGGPTVDFPSPGGGMTAGVVGASVREHDSVANIERLFKAAKQAN